mmetsp:Transcript_3279/g.11504  ORF Transcript_3279/g.11504 Transcript_3279/m.11504 type:complete len:389 (+) Transcript_3279:216-1382(+)
MAQEGLAPAPQCLGIVGTEGQLVHHPQAGLFGMGAELARAGQQPAGEDVLLDEIGGAHIALEQLVPDRDALDAGAPARLELVVHGAEIAIPILAADGLEHLDADHRVIAPVADVAVVLQAQVGAQAGVGQPPLRPGQLLGGERHAGQPGAEVPCGDLGHRAPAAADLQHAAALAHPGLGQRTAHLGPLGGVERALCGAGEPGAGVVHRRVQPQLVEVVAEVVVGVDVLAAAGAGVAMEQVTQAVQQAAPEAAVDQGLQRGAVADEQLQQGAQVAAAPVPGDEAFRETDVSRLQHRGADGPVRDAQGRAGAAAIAKLQQRALGGLQVKAAVAQVGQQREDLARRSRQARVDDGGGSRRGHVVQRVTKRSGGSGLEKKGTRLIASRSACQ